MKNLGIAAVLFCILGLELARPATPGDGHSSLAMKASTTVGNLHVDLRKTAYGPFRVSLGYGTTRSANHGTERAGAISLTLGAASEEV